MNETGRSRKPRGSGIINRSSSNSSSSSSSSSSESRKRQRWTVGMMMWVNQVPEITAGALRSAGKPTRRYKCMNGFTYHSKTRPSRIQADLLIPCDDYLTWTDPTFVLLYPFLAINFCLLVYVYPSIRQTDRREVFCQRRIARNGLTDPTDRPLHEWLYVDFLRPYSVDERLN